MYKQILGWYQFHGNAFKKGTNLTLVKKLSN